jgi:hypothetical protein
MESRSLRRTIFFKNGNGVVLLLVIVGGSWRSSLAVVVGIPNTKPKQGSSHIIHKPHEESSCTSFAIGTPPATAKDARQLPPNDLLKKSP